MVSTYVPFIVENTVYTFVWMFSIMLLRREFMKIGQTSCALLSLWLFLLLTPMLILLIGILEIESVSSFRLIATLLKLIFNFFVVSFTLCRRVDIGDIYSRTSSVYNQMVKSYFLEDESVENPDNIWDKWDKLAEESTSLIERENIKSVILKGTEARDTPKGQIVFYTIEICYGKTKDLTRFVNRRFREFLVLYLDLKSANPTVDLPLFPKILQSHEQLTQTIISERCQYFNQIFSIIMKNKLNCPLFSKFFSSKFDNEVVLQDPKLRAYSCVSEMPVEIELNKAFRKSSRFVTQANYEVVVNCGGFVVKVQHTFGEFKDLRKKLLKKNKMIEELPQSKLLKSSANPELVKERKRELQRFLQKMVDDPELKTDKDLIKFLSLDMIYF